MLNLILPLITVVMGTAPTAPDPVTELRGEDVTWQATAPRVAQVRLAETLAEAEAIHTITTRGRTIRFAIDHGGVATELVATVNARGEVIRLASAPRAADPAALGGLSWLGPELAEAAAVTRLVPDEDGAVTIVTSDGDRYMAIPGRGSGGNAAGGNAAGGNAAGGNAAVDARWAAAWDATDAT